MSNPKQDITVQQRHRIAKDHVDQYRTHSCVLEAITDCGKQELAQTLVAYISVTPIPSDISITSFARTYLVLLEHTANNTKSRINPI